MMTRSMGMGVPGGDRHNGELQAYRKTSA
jgi:hypothetical protein